MAKNDFLARQKQREQEVWNAAFDTGFQQCFDLFCAALQEKEVTPVPFRKKMLAKVYGMILYYRDKSYGMAFDPFHPEADYWQEKLDSVLREIWGDELVPFEGRFPYLKKSQYKKPYK